MELQKWKVFQQIDPTFAADVKRAYLVCVSSIEDDSSHVDNDENAEKDENSGYKGGVVIMRNEDVYLITRTSVTVSSAEIDEPEDLLPFVPVKLDALCGQRIRAISSGSEQVVVLTVEGRIYQYDYGSNNADEKQYLIFKPEFGAGDENKGVIQIACGQDHTVALTSEGDVYTWGSNTFGQLGTGSRTNETSITKISGLNTFNAKISMVACCGWTSFALDKDGTVWSWGDNEDGALGYESTETQKIPRKITRLENIKMIAAGNSHALALSTEGQLYFWGQHGSEGTTVAPKKIDISNIAFIGAIRGCGISTFQTTKRKVYYWGFACGHYIREPAPTKFSTIAEVFASLDSPMMFEPLTLDQKQSIPEKLKLNLGDKDTADISFSVEGKIIYAHRAILKSRSDHFKRVFDNNWKEDSGKEVEIAEFSYQGFHAFLFYLYTDRIDPSIRTATYAIELLRISDHYGEEDLKQRCGPLLKILITKDKVSIAYAVSCRYNANDLRELALDFIIPNLNNVVKTEEFRKMGDDLKGRLFQELAEEDVLVGLKRKRNEDVN